MSVQRLDRIEAPAWASSKFEATPEGYLRGRAAITNIGIFPYRKADGSITWELRHPDDVFHPDTMASFAFMPLTNEHPSEMITADNIKEHQVGNLGEHPINVNDMYLACDMVIQEKNAINDVLAGKRGLSVGYSCEVVEESGTWLGVPYDARQKNIRANHVAIVDEGRAGETAVIKLDAADAILVKDAVPRIAQEKKDIEEEPMADLKKIKLDGVEYDAEAAVITALHTATEKVDSLQTSLDALGVDKSTIEAERDTLKDQVATLSTKNAELEATKIDEAVITAAVLRRCRILDSAKSAEIALTEDMKETDIQKAVVLKVFPSVSLDGKDNVYLDACFDRALDVLAQKADASTREVGSTEAERSDGVQLDIVSAARKRYRDSLTKKGE